MAFNTGIHSRYCPPPIWVIEGLATLFEAQGVYNSRTHTSRADRINRQRLRDYRKLAARNPGNDLPAKLTASDGLFRTHPAAAYAEAWALTFYLVETQPRQFAKYLAKTNARAPFSSYTAAERVADFTSVFGTNWQLLDAKFARFMAGVK